MSTREGLPGMRDDAAARALLRRIAPPRIGLDLIRSRVLEEYGLGGDWKALSGEREQNYRLRGGGRDFVVKVASADEGVDGLRFEAAALAHIERVDPDLPVPRVIRTTAGDPLATIVDSRGVGHALRVLSFVPGTTVIERLRQPGSTLSMQDLFNLGLFHGRLARALQGLHHPGAGRPVPWNLANGLILGSWLQAALPEPLRDTVHPVLLRLERDTLPALARLRSQVIHGDYHEANVLVRDTPVLQVCGIIDFGDMRYGAVVEDLAVAVASLIHWSADPVRAAAALTRGFQRQMPLEADDLSLLLDLTLARMVLQIGLVGYQEAETGRHDADNAALQSLYADAVRKLGALHPDAFRASMTPAVVPRAAATAASPAPAIPAAALLSRRQAVLGRAYMFYDEPLELVRGEGCRLYDAAGKDYLDCYNNVANLGHAHPYVVDALARQAATLNTNSRYLHGEILRLGERLSATLPDGLDTWFFVCTGSEANDLAVRIARTVTGRHGVAVTEHGYHGNTALLTPLSLLEYDIADKPDWVAAVPPPNVYRGRYRSGEPELGARYAAHVQEAAQQLNASGQGLSALMLDSIFDGNGALVPPPDYLRLAFAHARHAGALTIADEVQMGFARSGTHMWGFQAFGVDPDIVTMGKPMGNGHPIAALVTRRDIALAFQEQTGYFNTFGGNTVSAVVANAALDVLEGDALQERASRVGAHLGALLETLETRHDLVGHIHGRGLFYGVELVAQRTSREPAKHAARWVRERMKTLGVLVASSGPLGNIIKIRPPLCFEIQDAEQCFSALDRALAEIPPDRKPSSA